MTKWAIQPSEKRRRAVERHRYDVYYTQVEATLAASVLTGLATVVGYADDYPQVGPITLVAELCGTRDVRKAVATELATWCLGYADPLQEVPPPLSP